MMTKKPITGTFKPMTPEYISQLHHAAQVEARVRAKLEAMGWAFVMDEVEAPRGMTQDAATAVLLKVFEEAQKEVEEERRGDG